MGKIKRKDINDSSSFYKVAKVQTDYQPELTSANAGSNVTITKVDGITKINATGGQTGEYTAGSGIDITDRVISNTAQPDVNKEYVDGKVTELNTAIAGKQNVITAGSNLTKSGDTISLSPVISLNSGNMEFITETDGTTQGMQRVIATMYDQQRSKMMPVDTIMTTELGCKAGWYYTYNPTNHITEMSLADDETGDPSGRISPADLNADSQQIPNCAWVNDKIAQQIASKSTVSVSASGTATDEVEYITIDGTEKKIKSGSGSAYTAGKNIDITDGVISTKDTLSFPTGITGYSRSFIELPMGEGIDNLLSVDFLHTGTTEAFSAKAGLFYVYDSANHITALTLVDDESGPLTGRISPASLNSDGMEIPNTAWVNDKIDQQISAKSARPPVSVTIFSDGTATTYTASHSLGKEPSIVQVTKDSNGVVLNDVTIAKTGNSVVVTFQTAPASGETFTVSMLY